MVRVYSYMRARPGARSLAHLGVGLVLGGRVWACGSKFLIVFEFFCFLLGFYLVFSFQFLGFIFEFLFLVLKFSIFSFFFFGNSLPFFCLYCSVFVGY